MDLDKKLLGLLIGIGAFFLIFGLVSARSMEQTKAELKESIQESSVEQTESETSDTVSENSEHE
jgi:hypothetical protein